MATTSWAAWLHERLDERRWRQADLVKHGDDTVTRAKVSRWLAGDHVPDIGSIRAVCVALGVPAVEGMIAAGHLVPDDVGATVITRPRHLDELASLELLDELRRREESRQNVTEELGPDDATPKRRKVPPVGREGEQWAARRTGRHQPPNTQ